MCIRDRYGGAVMSDAAGRQALVGAQTSLNRCFAALTEQDPETPREALQASLSQLEALRDFFEEAASEAETGASVQDDIQELERDIGTKDDLIKRNATTVREWAEVFDKLAAPPEKA
eukprot:TRINITY_DN17821_c0_g2_i3.p3 TRINITY_DN17821_c0_g2~~TRINITY_DN17821_c0_g2_i3.p3  ORF type:complete len:117 (+),score=51.36 TRINITY_DN17821_c0_g2_i3:149-499(+)